jgi:hypothetical protein
MIFSCVFTLCLQIIGSLENAGEVSVLSMLRSVRLVLGLLAEGTFHPVSSCNGVDVQVTTQLPHFACLYTRAYL